MRFDDALHVVPGALASRDEGLFAKAWPRRIASFWAPDTWYALSR